MFVCVCAYLKKQIVGLLVSNKWVGYGYFLSCKSSVIVDFYGCCGVIFTVATVGEQVCCMMVTVFLYT